MASAIAGGAGGADVAIPVNEATRAATADKRLEGVKLPGACSNTGPFMFIVCVFCTMAVIAPVLVLTVGVDEATEAGEDTSMMTAIGIELIALTLLICCCMLQPLWCGGVFNVPEAPAYTGPLVKCDDGDKRYEVRSVKRVALLVNPMAGVKAGPAAAAKAVAILKDEFSVETRVIETQYAGHAIDIAREMDLTGLDALCVIGGDGSFHELVNGMLTRADPSSAIPVGLIPGGSGNSVMHDLQLNQFTPDGFEEAVRRIGRGGAAWIDANEVTIDGDKTLWSINELTWGLTGEVGVVAEGWRVFGPARYDICAVWGILKGSSDRLRLVVDGVETMGSFVTAFVNQTQFFGKALRAAPMAKIDDGLLDVAYMHSASRAELLRVFLQLPLGAHTGTPQMTFKQAKEVTFIPDRAGAINIDGENHPYSEQFTLQCRHKAFQMFMPHQREYKTGWTALSKEPWAAAK